jgi:hypothetical protein
MTLTININSCIVPVAITAISIISVSIVAYKERNEPGYFVGTVLVSAGALIGTAISWIVWGLMCFFK